MKLFSIDPGNTQSAYIVLDVTGPEPSQAKILGFAKTENREVRRKLDEFLMAYDDDPEAYVIVERLAGMGMNVGREVLETAEQYGRFQQQAAEHDCSFDFIYRREEKVDLCGQAKAKDSNIRQALIDRYATFDFKRGTGTKKNPDVLYGVSKDVWAALAVATTWIDKHFKQGYFAVKK